MNNTLIIKRLIALDGISIILIVIVIYSLIDCLNNISANYLTKKLVGIYV